MEAKVQEDGSTRMTEKAAKFGKFVAVVLIVYVVGFVIYAAYRYEGTKSKLLTYGISDATGSLVAWVVMLLALGIPALAILRIFTLRARPQDYVAATFLPLVSWGIVQLPAKFDARTGESLQYCAPRPDDTLFCLDHPGVDPLTKRALVAISSDTADIEYRKEKGLVPKPITKPVSEIDFFDPLTSQARVWILKNDDGCFDMFDHPGAHPQTGERLQAVTKETVRRIKQCATKILTPGSKAMRGGITENELALTEQEMRNPRNLVKKMIEFAGTGNDAGYIRAKQALEVLPKPVRGNRSLAEELDKQATNYWLQNNIPEAIRLAIEACRADDSYATARQNLSVFWAKAGDLARAEDGSFEALAREPFNGGTWGQLANVYAQKGDLDRAASTLVVAYRLSGSREHFSNYLLQASRAHYQYNPGMNEAARRALALIER